jgi:peptidoglycan/LPS O-acetylase OafA/YrhL
LDGLRGIAALIVLIYHALGPTYGIAGFRGGFLAVDFFFMLSGFVVARAYEQRLADGLSFAGFLKIRFDRLYPTIAAGVLIGAVAFMATGKPALILTLMSLLMIPSLSHRDGLFPVNGPSGRCSTRSSPTFFTHWR